jgi:hypothetical protein
MPNEIHQIKICSPTYKRYYKSRVDIGISGHPTHKECTTIVGVPYLNGALSVPNASDFSYEKQEIAQAIMGFFNNYNPAPKTFRLNLLTQIIDYAIIRKYNAGQMYNYWFICGSACTSQINSSLIIINMWDNYIHNLEIEYMNVLNTNAS